MDQPLRRDDAAGFLASLAVADRAALVELGRSVSVPAGRSLFLAGSVPDAVYVVRSGRIRLSRSDSDGATLALGLRSAGDVLGLAELFTGADRIVEAYADQPSDVLRVPADRFLAWVRDRPAAMAVVLATLGARLRQVGDVAASVAHDTAEVRIARLLLALAERHGATGRPSSERHDGVTVQVTQQQIAELVGASRQTVNLAVGRLTGQGALSLRRGEVEVRVQALETALAGMAAG